MKNQFFKNNGKSRKGDKLTIAFIGSVLDDWDSDIDRSYQKSPTIEIQQSLINEMLLKKAPLDRIYTVQPFRRFPHEPFRWIFKRSGRYHGRVPTFYLGICNLEPLKTLSIGLQGFAKMLWWGLKKKLSGQIPLFFVYNLGPTHHQLIFVVMAAKLIGAKVVSLLTDIYPPTRKKRPPLLERILFSLQVVAIRGLNGMIALNENTIKDFGQGMPCLHLHGIVPNDNMIEALADLDLVNSKSKSPFTIAYLGSLNDPRGVDVLLEAFTNAPDNWRLMIAGKGTFEEIVTRKASEDQRISFHGFISEPDAIVNFIENASCLVNPHRIGVEKSRYVFPSKLTEYMASGRPVVSTDHGDVYAIYHDFIWITEDDSPEALLSKLKEVASIHPDAIREKLAKAREHVLNEKLWSHNVVKILSFIRDI